MKLLLAAQLNVIKGNVKTVFYLRLGNSYTLHSIAVSLPKSLEGVYSDLCGFLLINTEMYLKKGILIL